MIYDGHTHIWTLEGNALGDFEKDEIAEFKKMFSALNYSGLINSTSRQEFDSFKTIVNSYVSFGIHPWQADDYTDRDFVVEVQTLAEVYENADAIGEIGLDSVWCDCKKEDQMTVFVEQMEIAQKLEKPVVLHFKGLEKDGLNVIEKYDLRKLIHWYSCEDFLNEFIELDCYFTVGIDVLVDKKISAQIAQEVPIDRILLETDGTEAAEWGLRREVVPFELPELLNESLAKVAKIRGVNKERLEGQLRENFFRFLKGA